MPSLTYPFLVEVEFYEELIARQLGAKQRAEPACEAAFRYPPPAPPFYRTTFLYVSRAVNGIRCPKFEFFRTKETVDRDHHDRTRVLVRQFTVPIPARPGHPGGRTSPPVGRRADAN